MSLQDRIMDVSRGQTGQTHDQNHLHHPGLHLVHPMGGRVVVWIDVWKQENFTLHSAMHIADIEDWGQLC